MTLTALALLLGWGTGAPIVAYHLGREAGHCCPPLRHPTADERSGH